MCKARRRRLRDETIESAREVASSVLSGQVPDRVAGATHYHADYVSPYWASSGTRVTKIGAHIFYRMPGDLAAASTVAIANEPDIEALSLMSPQPRWRPQIATHTAQAEPRPLFAPWGLPLSAAGATDK